ILSTQDEVLDNRLTQEELNDFYEIVWDDKQSHKFKNISHHLQRIKAFKLQD
ncbi:MAG: YqiA/YcfP family alpha/beta fold hydrolase, partial [Plesiomonas shigelloides]